MSLPNLRMPTMGGNVWWDTLESQRGFKLQQNKITDHCRILDPANCRIDWGDERSMRNSFSQITG